MTDPEVPMLASACPPMSPFPEDNTQERETSAPPWPGKGQRYNR
jgi:hypothetical protein